jgi:hypothetical protein
MLKNTGNEVKTRDARAREKLARFLDRDRMALAEVI